MPGLRRACGSGSGGTLGGGGERTYPLRGTLYFTGGCAAVTAPSSAASAPATAALPIASARPRAVCPVASTRNGATAVTLRHVTSDALDEPSDAATCRAIARTTSGLSVAAAG
jgi:hypothetical protein